MQYAPGSANHFEDWELDLIRREAEDFFRKRKLRWSDAGDLHSAGCEAWWRQRSGWDASRSSAPSYLKRVVRHAFEDIANAESSQGRRAAHTAVSLDLPLPGGDASLAEFLADPDESVIAVALDVQRVVAGLSERQKAIVRGRLAGYETAALAKNLHVHRDTVYEDLKRIQAAFRDAGLGERELRSDT